MVKFLFKLKKSYVPDLTQKTDKDQLYGGIRLIYKVYRCYFIILKGREYQYFRKKIGLKTFLRPYKKYWDKHTYRLPYVYWGNKKHPLTRLWVVIPNNYPLGITKIIPEISLINQQVKLFGHMLRSKKIASYLFSQNDKFYVKPTLINNQNEQRKSNKH